MGRCTSEDRRWAHLGEDTFEDASAAGVVNEIELYAGGVGVGNRALVAQEHLVTAVGTAAAPQGRVDCPFLLVVWTALRRVKRVAKEGVFMMLETAAGIAVGKLRTEVSALGIDIT